VLYLYCTVLYCTVQTMNINEFLRPEKGKTFQIPPASGRRGAGGRQGAGRGSEARGGPGRGALGAWGGVGAGAPRAQGRGDTCGWRRRRRGGGRGSAIVVDDEKQVPRSRVESQHTGAPRVRPWRAARCAPGVAPGQPLLQRHRCGRRRSSSPVLSKSAGCTPRRCTTGVLGRCGVPR